MSSSPEKENPSFYAVIPAFVRYNKSLSPSAKLLYGEITALANKEGYCWASNKYFAGVYGVDKSSITHWIKQLSDEGYISLEFIYEDGKPNITERRIYIVDLSPQKENQYGVECCQKIQEPVEGLGGGEKTHHGVVKNFNGGGEKTHHGVVKNFNGGGEKTPEIILQANNTRAAAADQVPKISEKPPPEETATAFSMEDIGKLKSHFAGLDKNLVFDEAFYPKVLSFLSDHGLGFDYVSWMHDYCSRKNPNSLSGYLFKTLLEPRYVEIYREASRPPSVMTVSCPVCGRGFDSAGISCPECSFEKIHHLDAERIKDAKAFYSLAPDLKKAYQEEFKELSGKFLSMEFLDIVSETRSLKHKYGLV